MAREPLHSSDVKIEQKPSIVGNTPNNERRPDVVIADKLPTKEYADALAFAEEPVTIRLEPSQERNSANVFEVAVNGIGAEVWMNGRWVSIRYLPVGQNITIKRKYLEVIVRAKIDMITTQHDDANVAMPMNRIDRTTTAARSFSIIKDKNPLGAAWIAELIRRNY